MKDCYKIKTRPQAVKENVICGEKYRITVLTDCLLRLEYSKEGKFEDRATQTVLCRDFPKVKFQAEEKEGRLEVKTGALQLLYDGEAFSAHGLSVSVKDKKTSLHKTWYYGDEIRDLKGTARTLDNVNGSAVKLERGILSREGYSVLDDSRSLLLKEDGWVEPSPEGRQDLYFFGYGHDYKQALADFYYLCGKTPMLPRYALGNWWSRYYPYTQEEYLQLMDRFSKAGIPLSAAVIDMDWHLVDIAPKYGTGWTGFTWNEELFPDHVEFLKKLHEKGLKVTLNLHPADGIRGYEKVYPTIAAHMEVDAESEETVLFDVSNPEFLEHYFEDVLHPMEEEGVDFWWLDWQQGSHSRIKNLDPLWILNHLHYLDNQKSGKRALAFSRYAGPGSHRYPVGFSGDTIVSWESLRFQPYFTATASNIGYGWWSHDIGGHMLGYKDEELMARWVQLGTFSPVLRLHSTNCPFNSKEPWRYSGRTEKVMTEFLRLRHKLLPYLYTMNYEAHENSIPLVRPLYYEYPEQEEAYTYGNEYYFGDQLLVLPVTSKAIPGVNRAKEILWLPEGIWYDVFSARVYKGGRTLNSYRKLEDMPVFAKAGGIVPMTEEIEGGAGEKNPCQLHICVYLGAEGSFVLYEDDNETNQWEEGSFVQTEMKLYEKEKGGTAFCLVPRGDFQILPEKRSYCLEFTGCKKPEGEILVKAGGQRIQAEKQYDKQRHILTLEIPAVPACEKIEIEFDSCMTLMENPVLEDVFAFLDEAEISYVTKEQIYQLIKEQKELPLLFAQLVSMELDKELLGALTELLTAF